MLARRPAIRLGAGGERRVAGRLPRYMRDPEPASTGSASDDSGPRTQNDNHKQNRSDLRTRTRTG